MLILDLRFWNWFIGESGDSLLGIGEFGIFESTLTGLMLILDLRFWILELTTLTGVLKRWTTTLSALKKLFVML